MRKTLVTIGISTATVNAVASPLMFVLQGPSAFESVRECGPSADLAMLGMFSAGLAFMLSLGERFEGEIPPDPKINAAGWIALVVLGIPAIAVVALLVYFVEP